MRFKILIALALVLVSVGLSYFLILKGLHYSSSVNDAVRGARNDDCVNFGCSDGEFCIEDDLGRFACGTCPEGYSFNDGRCSRVYASAGGY